ncbi:P-loop containing nucleoside triphosphate hydrolase protein [Mycena leptocephala]|nr:P-loop containing nucleoside triphosphate hydrolase protein [Mycena leptocephala]
MMFLPRALSAIADVRNALPRLSLVFRTRLHEGVPFVVDPEQEAVVWAKEAGWVWGEKEKQNENEEEHPPDEQPPFAMHNITLSIPCGTLAAVIGRVGSGKTSLLQLLSLQGFIGEMHSTDTGSKRAFGGSVVYCPQSAWIQNGTLGQHALRAAVRGEQREDSCLLPDLQLLADGDLTEIGEKGINLSGGQKQRVNTAHALYYGADVVIFDDPLSAVDAKVGKALFHSAIQGLVTLGKTVLLVAHALHFLAQCNFIYTLDGGCITEAGTYPELIARGATIDNAPPNLTEDLAIVAKRTELAQRMKMLDSIRKDLMAFEK